MKEKKIVLPCAVVFSIAFFIAGCFSAFNILESFSITRMNKKTFRISSTYGFASSEQAFDFALLKASQISLRNRKLYFTINSEKTETTGTTTFANRWFLFGFPLVSYSQRAQRGIALTITLLDAKPVESSDKVVADARVVVKDLKAKYNLE